MKRCVTAIVLILLFICSSAVYAFEREDMEFKIFQFPRTMMPRIDGDTSDWDMVGEDYTYGLDLLNDTADGMGTNLDPKDKDITVRVGWVEGLNRLYFLYESYDDYWDIRFANGYSNDIFEIAVDGDISGGPFISNPQTPEQIDQHFRFSGIHAQNYHIFTPPVNNQWCMVWGCQPWACRFPYANYAYSHNIKKQGDSGHLVLELWITPFDYAPNDPTRAVESKLTEDEIIGLSWSILEFDGGRREGHINLAHNTEMVKDGSALCKFRLMPLEKQYVPEIEARWTFEVVDMERRIVYFKDESVGEITKWTWDFGDGETSNEQNPVHQYKKGGIHQTVVLEVEGPAGASKHSIHWDVSVR